MAAAAWQGGEEVEGMVAEGSMAAAHPLLGGLENRQMNAGTELTHCIFFSFYLWNPQPMDGVTQIQGEPLFTANSL